MTVNGLEEPEVYFDKKYPNIQLFFGKGHAREVLRASFLEDLRLNLLNPIFSFEVKDGIIYHLNTNKNRDTNKIDSFIINTYIEDFKNNNLLNRLCEHVIKYMKSDKNVDIIKNIHSTCFNDDSLMYSRYTSNFQIDNDKFIKNLRILWVFSITMYLVWRPYMNVSPFIDNSTRFQPRVLPRLLNYFKDSNQKKGDESAFIKNNLNKLNIILNTNFIPDNIYTFFGAPYCAIRVAQHESERLKNRIFDLEQEIIYLKKSLNGEV